MLLIRTLKTLAGWQLLICNSAEENNRRNRQASHHQRAETAETRDCGRLSKKNFCRAKVTEDVDSCSNGCFSGRGASRRTLLSAHGKVPHPSTMAVMTWCL